MLENNIMWKKCLQKNIIGIQFSSLAGGPLFAIVCNLIWVRPNSNLNDRNDAEHEDNDALMEGQLGGRGLKYYESFFKIKNTSPTPPHTYAQFEPLSVLFD